MVDWIWDVDKKYRVKSGWVYTVEFWHILPDGDQFVAIGVVGEKALKMCRGTEKECQCFIAGLTS